MTSTWNAAVATDAFLDRFSDANEHTRALLTPPDWLDVRAREHWMHEAPAKLEAGVLTSHTRGLFAAQCAAYSLIERSRDELTAGDLATDIGASMDRVALELYAFLTNLTTSRAGAMRKD